MNVTTMHDTVAYMANAEKVISSLLFSESINVFLVSRVNLNFELSEHTHDYTKSTT